MEFHDNKLSPYLIGLGNEIRTNPETLTLDTIHQTEEKLHSIISQLNDIRNSRFAVHRTPADVLHNIFTFAIYSSEHPDHTVLAISRVCRFWRKLALGWPTLWRFLNLSNSPSVVKLFTNQSKNTRLSLLCIWHYIPDPTKTYFKSCANLILPRLNSLTLHVPHPRHYEISPLFQDPLLPPLRLQHLDFKLIYDRKLFSFLENPPCTVTDFMRVDISCLRELKLEETDLPWLQLPHNKLTHFKLLYPIAPPSLSQLSKFLSNCPLLCELELGLGCRGDRNISSNSSTINRLDFPNLKKLTLVLDFPTSSEFDYLQKLSARIQPLKSLSRFKLSYNGFFDNGVNLSEPFNVFGPVPSGTFSRFGGHHYLSISLQFESYSFRIYSAPGPRDDYHDPPNYPLILSGNWTSKIPLDRTPILELMRAMPEITHLNLRDDAWQILASWRFDVRDAFPYLHTLELSLQPLDIGDSSWALDSLSRSLQVKTLILTGVRVISFDLRLLFDAVLKIGAETLELGIIDSDDAGLSDVVAILRQMGTKVSVKWIH